MPTLPTAKLELNNQYAFYRILHASTEIAVWTYFVLLLLRASKNDVSLIFVHGAILATGIIAGYTVNSVFISKLGYTRVWKLFCTIAAFTSLITLATLHITTSIFPVIASLMGLSYGIFWSAVNLFQLREVRGQRRSQMFSLYYSAQYVLEVLLPVSAGALIAVTGGYDLLFLLATAIYLLGALYPWKGDRVPRDTLNVGELKAILRRRGIRRWSAILYFDTVNVILRNMVLITLPFLFIQSEFGVGVLSSFIGLLGALFIFIHRRDGLAKKVHIGYIGGTIVIITNFIMLYFWTLPAVVFRMVVSKFGFAMYDPVGEDISYRNEELILGDLKNGSSVEMQFYREVVIYLGKMTVVLLFVMVYLLNSLDMFGILRVLFLFSALREVIVLWLHSKLNRDLLR